jgi:hypothetical protein
MTHMAPGKELQEVDVHLDTESLTFLKNENAEAEMDAKLTHL